MLVSSPRTPEQSMTTNALLATRPQDGEVLTIVKTPGMLRAASVTLPPSTTLGEPLQQLLKRPIKSDDDQRFAEHLRREISGPHNLFVVTPSNQMVEVKPQTRLAEIAIPTELTFPEGPRSVPCVAVEVVQYASVGA
jgi:hypothetical protein